MTPWRPFRDRLDAGRRLARQLDYLRGRDLVVLGLPRGGVPVAYEVAKALGAPLDVIVVRKLGLPIQPEVAMGAIGEGGFEMLDRPLIVRACVTDAQIRAVEQRENAVLEERLRRLRQGREPEDLRGRTAVIVDDGLATGATARVACRVARHRGAKRVVLAVPVGPSGVESSVPEADEVVCLRTPEPFTAVGGHYLDFRATSDDEVVAILENAARAVSAAHERNAS